jgi:argininosuccinate lyase
MSGMLDEFDAARRAVAGSAVAVSDLILDAAVKKIDGLFGKGYAQANPGLVGHYLVATARTFQNDMAAITDVAEDADFDEMLADFDRRS